MKLANALGLVLVLGAIPAIAETNADQHGATGSGVANTEAGADPSMSDPATAPTGGFDELDTNGDGYLSMGEADDIVDDYEKVDANSDGRLDRAEFSAFEMERHVPEDSDTDLTP